MKLSEFALASVFGLAIGGLAPPVQAAVTYEYSGNPFPAGPVVASVTFDSTVNSSFSGLVGLDHITHWHIDSELFSISSAPIPAEPDASGFIPLRFEFTSGAITRWDFAHNPGSGYDVYTLGQSFVVGGGTTEDGALDIAGVGRGVTNNPGAWSVAAVPIPAGLWLLGSALGGFGFIRRRAARESQ